MNDNIIKQPPLPDTIQFHHTRENDRTEVMRITREGVWVNPDMQVDETAKAVLDALSSQVKVLVQRAVEEEREKVAKWMMGQGYATGHGDTIEDLLEELEWQVAPVHAVNMSQECVDETAKGGHEWVGLTDEESKPLIQKAMMYYGHNPDHWTLTAGAGFCIFARAIEAKLKEKNA